MQKYKKTNFEKMGFGKENIMTTYELQNKRAFKKINKKSDYIVRKELNEVIDNILLGKMPIGNQVIFKKVPKILLSLGVHDKPIFMSPREIRNAILSKEKALYLKYPVGKNENYHNLGKKIFNIVLNNIKHPVMVIKESKNKIIIFTETFDYKNNQIIVPMEINTNSEYNTIEVHDINIIKSIHGRSRALNYISNLLNKGSNIIYIDIKKIQSLSENRKVQYPEAISSVSTNNDNITSDKSQVS